jgi:hypothetical protein
VPLAKSAFSSSTTDNPRDKASRATPKPEAPPPITAISQLPDWLLICAKISVRFILLIFAQQNYTKRKQKAIKQNQFFVRFPL